MIKKNRAEERLCPDFCAFVLFESSLCQTQKKSHTVWCGMTGRTRSPVVCAQSRHPHTKEQSTGLFFSAAPNVLFESSLCQTQKKSHTVWCGIFLADREGFEPSNPLWGLHDFQSCALDQLSHLSTLLGRTDNVIYYSREEDKSQYFYKIFLQKNGPGQIAPGRYPFYWISCGGALPPGRPGSSQRDSPRRP